MTKEKQSFTEPAVVVYTYEEKDIITASIALPESYLPAS